MPKVEPRSPWIKVAFIALSIAVLASTFSAGLWPFEFHKKNDVLWKPDEDGLYFGDTGMVISDGKFAGLPGNGSTDCSIEMWMEPELSWDSSSILSFYEPGVSPPRMQIRQSGDDVVFASTNGNGTRQASVFADHVFHKHVRVLVTFVSSNGTLKIYANGAFRQATKSARMQPGDFRGTLIVANVQKGNLSWTGIFRGLAFYDRALSAAEVGEHYRLWQTNRETVARANAAPASLYLFTERQGEKIHNAGHAGPDLIIPRTFFIFEPRFLVPFWEEYRPSWDYERDIAINVFGLVPAGFCFAGLLAWIRGKSGSLLYATLLGFCLSLTIEILQAFIPTRFSGTTDLITNTLGTGMGAWLYLNGKSQSWLHRLGLVRTK